MTELTKERYKDIWEESTKLLKEELDPNTTPERRKEIEARTEEIHAELDTYDNVMSREVADFLYTYYYGIRP